MRSARCATTRHACRAARPLAALTEELGRILDLGEEDRLDSLQEDLRRAFASEEEELEDLMAAVAAAKNQYGIQGVVTGAIESVYQAARVQRICRSRHGPLSRLLLS